MRESCEGGRKLMGYRCPKCATDNGITHYGGKCCKRCGWELVPKLNITGDDNHAKAEVEGGE